MVFLDGVANFFQFLYTKLVYSWNLIMVVTLFLVFVGLQVGIILFYSKLFSFFTRLKFPIVYWFRRLMS
jgi:hypothetical protein